jgi:hypothetical protein
MEPDRGGRGGGVQVKQLLSECSCGRHSEVDGAAALASFLFLPRKRDPGNLQSSRARRIRRSLRGSGTPAAEGTPFSGTAATTASPAWAPAWPSWMATRLYLGGWRHRGRWRRTLS